MKRPRIQSWRGQSLLTRPRHSLPHPHNHRPNSTQASQFSRFSSTGLQFLASPTNLPTRRRRAPSPSPKKALESAKLAALHARLALPPRFPLQTLARTLVDRTADQDARFNNESLSILGADVMGYYMAEHLICHYPRLPMDVLFAAQEAYVGPRALMTVAKEWGVQEAEEPGYEVEPGYLQFLRRARHGGPLDEGTKLLKSPEKFLGGGRANMTEAMDQEWRRGMSSRIVYDDQFGGLRKSMPRGAEGFSPVSTSQDANANFVRAVMGALHLHSGRSSARKFFALHFLSRVLNLTQLFEFRYPTRDLSRLCLREGFEPPVARLVSETGRKSAHPIFVVGVYSGRDKLGEAAGGSLDEAKNRAATAALKGWYLYSPLEVSVPSETEEPDGKEFKANLIDPGEIIT